MTSNRKSLSGATRISCFFDRMRRKVRSLEGSKSRTTLRALSASWLISPAYCTVVVLSRVLFTGIPEKVNKWSSSCNSENGQYLWTLTFIVHHNRPNDSLVGLDSLQGLLNFLRLKRTWLMGVLVNRSELTMAMTWFCFASCRNVKKSFQSFFPGYTTGNNRRLFGI